MPKGKKLHKNISVAYAKLTRRPDESLCRESNDTEEGKKGGGYVYFLKSTGAQMPPVSSKFLIDNGLVLEDDAGLFDGSGQSFAPVSPYIFDVFKEEYERAIQPE